MHITKQQVVQITEIILLSIQKYCNNDNNTKFRFFYNSYLFITICIVQQVLFVQRYQNLEVFNVIRKSDNYA